MENQKIHPSLILESSIEEEINSLAKEAEKKIRKLSKIILDGLKPPAGPYAFFHHSSHSLQRIDDCKKIVKRIFNQRRELTSLAVEEDTITPKDWPAGVHYPENVREVMHKIDETNNYMQIDFESLYMFGAILLDQWALQAIAVGCLPIKDGLKKSKPFVALLEFFEENKENKLSLIWKKLKEEMLWLNYQMRFYRNRFIVHANRPWQRGTTRSVYGDDYNLFTPTPPGWLDDEKLDEEIKKLINFAPGYIRTAPDNYWEKEHPAALIEKIFNNIGNVENKNDREKIASIYGQKGGTTPTFQVIAKRLFHFISESTNLLCDIVQNNLKNINLGNPYKTSNEMLKTYLTKMEKLQSQFQDEMLYTYREAKKLGYKPGVFLDMLASHGAVKTAKKLLSTEDYIQEGIKRLWELKRLDLSVEASVIKAEYKELFTEDEISIARKRLGDLGYLN